MSSANVTIRLDSEIKKQGEELFDDLGLSMTAAITAFIKQAIREQSIPFKITRANDEMPNKQTLKAIREVQEMEKNPEKYKTYATVKELFEDCLK